MSDVNIDWKGRALAAEAETLNLKNLCAHHGICTVCREYYSHHYTEPFATCKCNTSEWYEITEHMKLQDELRKLRQQKPFGRYVKIVDPIDKNKHTYGVDYYSGFYVADLLDKEVYTEPAPAPAVPSGWNIRRDGDVLIVQHPDIGGCSVQKEPDWERMIPEAILYSLADALLQPRAVKDSLTTQADCRACVNRGRINWLSQESYCDSCVYEGRGWRQNHFVDAGAKPAPYCHVAASEDEQ